MTSAARGRTSMPPPAQTTPDPYTGKLLLGRYRCLDRIGEGLTSVVYKVQHAKLRQNRAVKALRPELAKDPRSSRASGAR